MNLAKLVSLSIALLLIQACEHPIEIEGEGDVTSATGDRNCYLEDFQTAQTNCTKNYAIGAYQETYYAVPRAGWKFDHWVTYCSTAAPPYYDCGFNIAAATVQQFWWQKMPPLKAVFTPFTGTEPDPLATACHPLGAAPNPFVGGVTYSNWTFNTTGVSSIKMQSDIRYPVALDAALYFQLYDGTASNGQGYYMGIQSSGLMLFSTFGSIDESNIRTSPYSYAYAGTYEGPFLSLRVNQHSLPAGKYIMRVTKAEFDGVGDWYNLYAQSDRIVPGQEVYLGGMRFVRTNASQPVFLNDWGGSWTEYFGLDHNPVPYYDVVNTVLEAKGINNETLGVNNVTFYFRPEYPNSDIKLLDWTTYATQQRGGGSTQRCHMNGNIE